MRLAGRAGAYATGLGIAALVYQYAFVAYSIAYTECTAKGIRTRGLAGRRDCPWTQVRDISPVSYSRNGIVVVTTASGRRFWLGAPVDGGVMRDPEFAAKVLQIRATGTRPPRRPLASPRLSRPTASPRLSGSYAPTALPVCQWTLAPESG